MTDKKMTIEFAPGAFDNFDGTQEELDALMAEIHRMFESGELEEKSRPVDIEELIEEDPEYAEVVIKTLLNGEHDRELQ
jgi:hypothetical protein